MPGSRLERIEQKIAELEARRTVALNRLKDADRRRRVRQAILIGQYVVDRSKNAGEESERIGRFVRRIAETLTRPKDKELLLELVAMECEGSARSS